MDPDPGSIGAQLLLLLCLTAVNAFFACAEMAIVSVNKTKITMLAEEGNKRAKIVQKLLQEPTRFLSTIQVAITLAGFFSSASAATGISEVLGAALARAGVPYGQKISLVVVTVLLAFVSLGMVFSVVMLVFTGIITATGNSKTPFVATVAGLLLNIVLDPLLIFGPGPFPALGVASAALATVLSQALVVVLFVIYARQDTHLFCHVHMRRRPEGRYLREIVRIGLPTALQSMLFTSVSMVIARLIAGWGDAAVAVQKVGSQIESIAWMTADGFAAAVSSFVGQNYGAGDLQRAKKGYWISLATIVGWGIFCSLLLIFCAAPIFRIFIPDEQVVPLGVDYLVILGFSQMPMCVDIVTAGGFAGFGRTLPPSVATTLLVVSRIPLAMVLCRTSLGLNGIWWSISITSILRGIVLSTMMVLFLRRMTKRNNLASTGS